MKIVIGADHGGFILKEYVKDYLLKQGFEVEDFGTFSIESVDYPDIAKDVAKAVAEKTYKFGILICGTGIGISIAANKVKGARAALCYNEYSAKMTRMHNDANILCLGERVIGNELALSIVDKFLDTPFEGGRHQVRVDKISEIESN